MGKKLFLLLLLATAVYLPSLQYGFSQDDFIHLSASQANNLGEFLTFFNPFARYPDIFFYRPLATQVYFFLNTAFFGLNPLPFHLEALLLHFANAVLFYFLVKRLWHNPRLAVISALFYTISAAHFLSLYYISAFQQLARTFFLFLSIFAFCEYQQSKSFTRYLVSILTFILALLSKETSLILPVLLVFLEALRQKQFSPGLVKKLVKPLSAFFLVASIYLGLRFTGFGTVFGDGSYQFISSAGELAQNFKWYVLWSFGLPEILSTYPGLKQYHLAQFIKDFPQAFWILLMFVITLVCGVISLFRRRLLGFSIVISFAIFIVALSPVLILKEHKYPQYLDLAFVGLLPLFSGVFFNSGIFKKFFGWGGVIAFILLQIFSLNLSEQTHWTTHRAKVAAHYYEFFKKELTIPEEATIIFIGDQRAGQELSFALAKGYALRVWYPGQIKEVKYQLGVGEAIGPTTIIKLITVY